MEPIPLQAPLNKFIAETARRGGDLTAFHQTFQRRTVRPAGMVCPKQDINTKIG
ncbi:hypothetical protein PPMP20_11895 [Paraburkholderia phymatum]|uniref:hypothetical protein n=1 Tax=Paraburkholderia phymatum TaxID=148447 RepID=UPI0012FD849C|nr:hypothetical protein [Paraburkholderia phymatum]